MVDSLSPEARALLESSAVASLVTLEGDGAPHVSAAWIGVEDGEIVIGTLGDQRKLRNIRGDPRVALTVHGDRVNQWGLREYLAINGTARITEGGAPDLPSDLPAPTSARTSSSRQCPIHRRASSFGFASTASRASAPGAVADSLRRRVPIARLSL